MSSNSGQEGVSALQATPCSSIQVAEDSHPLLANSITKAYLPDLQKVQSSLHEVEKSQESLADTLQQENRRFAESMEAANVPNMISQIKLYHSKLVNVKKDMTSINEKSVKLKKRAEKIQQYKQKEALQKEMAREKEEERERHLVAQLAKKPS